MNDQQLIRLVQEKLPEELSPSEVALLRARIPRSAELREALRELLQTESALAEVLGGANVSVDDVLAGQSSDTASERALPLLGIVGCVVLLGLVAAVFLSAIRSSVLTSGDRAASLDTPKHGAGDKGKATTGDALGKRAGTAGGETGSTDGEESGAGEGNGTGANGAAHVDSPDGEDAGASGGDTENGSQSPPGAATVDAPASLPLTVQAEEFARGNVEIDNSMWGNAEIVVVRSDVSPSFAEYEFTLAQAASLRLKIRYASFDSRPLRLSINGKEVGTVAGEQTGSHLPDGQQWFTVGQYDFAQGKNTVRLETTGNFPHLDQFVIADPAADEVASADPHSGDPATGDPPIGEGGEPVPQLPWHDALTVEGDPPPFAEVGFGTFPTDKFLPQQDDLHKWVAPVDGFPYVVNNVNTQLGQCAAFNGLVRLKAPWTDQTALRLQLENYNLLRLHFFSGTRGLTLVYYEGDSFRWAAYATTRIAGEPRPETYALTATDDGRASRAEVRFGGPLELRYRAGEVILSRGDIVLLRGPLPDAPTAVYLDGQATFQGIAMVRSGGEPAAPAMRPVVADVERPADMEWIEQLGEGMAVEKLPDGAIRLMADKAKGRGWIAAPLPRRGLQEVIFEVEDATPGSGVYLGREQGKPLEVIRFNRNHRNGNSCLALRGDDDLYQDDYADVPERLVPATASRQWIRLLFGCGTLRWWMSSDGVHWAEPQMPVTNLSGGITHVGLHCVGGAEQCRITLRRVTLRELSALTSLADAELRDAAPDSSDAPNVGRWLVSVAESQPEGAESGAWRRACAVRALEIGCSNRLSQPLVEMLLDDAAAREFPLDQQLALGEEAALLLDVRDDLSRVNETVGRYYAVGLDELARHGGRPFSSIRSAVMTAPLATRQPLRIVGEEPIRAELIQLLYEGQWEEVLSFCQRLRYFQQHRQQPLVEWAELIAARRLGTAGGSLTLSRVRPEWQHPLVEELHKDTYNVLAELQAILESDAYDDAAQMIATMEGQHLPGVAPSTGDRQLLVSLPAAIRLAWEEHPGLGDVMNAQYGPVAQLRVKQAIAAGNVKALELITVQFGATEAAADAYCWLGDRALTAGLFDRALSYYRRAQESARAALGPELAARQRLASAMLGRDHGSAPTGAVRVGDVVLSVQEFESLVADARRRGETSTVAEAQDQRLAPAPPPTAYEVQVRGRLDNLVGEDPNGEVTRHVRRFDVDWVGRQIAAVVQGNMLYTSNRFHVAAYDLANGQRRWQSPRPSGQMLRAQEWSMIPMAPLVTERRIFVRLLYNQGLTLAAIDTASGQFVWTAQAQDNESIVSDPFLLQGQLLAFTLTRGEQEESVLRLVRFRPETGDRLHQTDVMRLRNTWWARRCCQIAVADESVIAAISGVVLSCDVDGTLLWVREQVITPTEEDPSWVTQHFQPPIIVGQRIYVAQPGVRTIECLSLETGRRQWQVVLPGVQRISGIAGQHLVVQTDTGFAAFDAEAGNLRWQHKTDGLLEGQLCGGEAGLLYARRASLRRMRGPTDVQLVWLDTKTGERVATAPLTPLEDDSPRLGPLVPHGDRLWAFFGRGTNEPNRDFVELIPNGPPGRIPALRPQDEVWLGHLRGPLRSAAAEAFPTWVMLSSGASRENPVTDEALGEHDVLTVRCDPQAPVVWGREVSFPPGSAARLRFKAAVEPNRQWRLDVRFAGESLWSQDIDAGGSPWMEQEIDLTGVAGKSGWLTVHASPVNGDTLTYWKTLELVE